MTSPMRVKSMVSYYAQAPTLNYDATSGTRCAAFADLIANYPADGAFSSSPNDAKRRLRYYRGENGCSAKLMMRRSNFLLLDEPTNNLDIPRPRFTDGARRLRRHGAWI
jgi:hypothetical protein